ncbi:putative hydrolase of the HAD superfamily [Micromonospora nigra]|uniref:Putative hydrolase of the HAD superfamily n=1 Tax=Micromonospora nigra TaxID=145857 RepID=A0A1C6R7R2_9ACTN|nr:HAD family hydrolase [Micromonospora nigra]SCL13096.1 putative hydrolase of the HAD superfamily [Micromonospora nigra]
MTNSPDLTSWTVSLDLWGTLIVHGDRAAVMDWRVAEFTRILDAFGHARPITQIRHAVTAADRLALHQQRHGGVQPTAGELLAGILEPLAVTATTEMLSVLEVVHTHASLRGCPRPIDGTQDALRALIGTGARLVLTSNTLSTSPQVHRQLLDDLELSPFFADMLFSGELGIAKPRPEVFATVAERAHTTPDRVIHVGDDWLTDVRGALDAGCRAVHYRPTGRPARPGVPTIAALNQLVDAVSATSQPAGVLSSSEPR